MYGTHDYFESIRLIPCRSFAISHGQCSRMYFELVPFFKAVLKEDWTEAKSQQKKIAKLENEADKLKKKLRLHLPKSLFMPISRRDLLEVLTMQVKSPISLKTSRALSLAAK